MRRAGIISHGCLRPKYPPNCVFSEEHMQLYVQHLQINCQMDVDHSTAPFPTAREFNAFIRAQGPRYPQAVHPCTHPRHPNDTAPSKYCPLCSFRIHENYIKFITVAWERKGAPWVGNRADQEYENIKHAYLIARLAFSNDMDVVADLAVQEQAWNAEHPFTDTTNTNSYSKVLAMYQLWLDPMPDTPRFVRRPDRKVKFAESTENFTASQARPGVSLSRRRPEYSAGRHACPSEEGWQNTSGSMSYLLLQCKLYVVKSLEDMMDPSNPPNNSTYLGMLADYAYQDEILSHIDKMYRESTEPVEFSQQLKACDAILTLQPEVRERHGRNEIRFTNVLPVSLEKDDDLSSTPSHWDVTSDPTVSESCEMDWE